jgi:hypothetical protein
MASAEKLITFPSPYHSPTVAVITQESIERLIRARNLFEQMKDSIEVLENSVRVRLEAGATIEQGPHFARLDERYRRNVSWRSVAERLADRLYGDGKGEAYCARVLGGTKPDRSVSLSVI